MLNITVFDTNEQAYNAFDELVTRNFVVTKKLAEIRKKQEREENQRIYDDHEKNGFRSEVADSSVTKDPEEQKIIDYLTAYYSEPIDPKKLRKELKLDEPIDYVRFTFGRYLYDLNTWTEEERKEFAEIEQKVLESMEGGLELTYFVALYGSDLGGYSYIRGFTIGDDCFGWESDNLEEIINTVKDDLRQTSESFEKKEVKVKPLFYTIAESVMAADERVQAYLKEQLLKEDLSLEYKEQLGIVLQSSPRTVVVRGLNTKEQGEFQRLFKSGLKS